MKNLELTIEWLHRQGHNVIRTESSYWFNQGPKVYQAFPYHWLITPSDVEIKDFFKKSNAIAIRYSTPLEQPEGKLSYHVVCDRESYELTSLHKKARHDVIHGLQYASYEPIDLTYLAHEGWDLYQDTLDRQGRKIAESRKFWEKMCLSADGLPAFEAWGALHEGKLIAALLAFTLDNTVSIIYQISNTQHRKSGVNNALTFVFTENVLHRPDIRCLFYGLNSLDAPASVDEFKFRMGYSAKPVRQRVVVRPIIKPLFNSISYAGVSSLHKFFPSDPTFAKTEGMMRFYFQGKHLLEEQEWPEILSGQKNAILAEVNQE